MAYNTAGLRLIKDLGPIHYWHYITADTPATVDTVGYFNSAAEILNVGDIVLVVQADSVTAPTTVTAAGHHIVNSNDGAIVDVTDATALSVTDTD